VSNNVLVTKDGGNMLATAKVLESVGLGSLVNSTPQQLADLESVTLPMNNNRTQILHISDLELNPGISLTLTSPSGKTVIIFPDGSINDVNATAPEGGSRRRLLEDNWIPDGGSANMSPSQGTQTSSDYVCYDNDSIVLPAGSTPLQKIPKQYFYYMSLTDFWLAYQVPEYEKTWTCPRGQSMYFEWVFPEGEYVTIDIQGGSGKDRINGVVYDRSKDVSNYDFQIRSSDKQWVIVSSVGTCTGNLCEVTRDKTRQARPGSTRLIYPGDRYTNRYLGMLMHIETDDPVTVSYPAIRVRKCCK